MQINQLDGPAKSPVRQAFLPSILCVTALLPFVSPVVVPSDVQPIFLIVSLILLFPLILNNEATFDYFDVAFGLFSLWSLVHIFEFSDFEFKKRAAVLAAFVFYYVYGKVYKAVSVHTVLLALAVLWVGIIFQMTFEGSNELFRPWLNRLNFGSHENRGYTSLTAEPTFLAASLAIIGLISIRRLNLIENTTFLKTSVIAAVSLGIILTKSFSGLVFLTLFLWFSCGAVLSSILVFMVVLYFSVIPDSGVSRIADVTHTIITLEIFSDASVGHRLSNIATASYSLWAYPLGVGAGDFGKVGLEAKSFFGLEVHDSSAERSVSAISTLLVEHGVVSLLFLFMVFVARFRNVALTFRLMSLLLLLTSFSVSFPGIWLLLIEGQKDA